MSATTDPHGLAADAALTAQRTEALARLELGSPVAWTRVLRRTSDHRAGVRYWTSQRWTGDVSGPVPRHRGILIGRRTLSNGKVSGGYAWDDPTVYESTETFLAFLVVESLHRRPQLVHPVYLEPLKVDETGQAGASS